MNNALYKYVLLLLSMQQIFIVRQHTTSNTYNEQHISSYQRSTDHSSLRSRRDGSTVN